MLLLYCILTETMHVVSGQQSLVANLETGLPARIPRIPPLAPAESQSIYSFHVDPS